MALGVPSDRDWLNGYYQFCNRVAVLHFLNNHRESSHLLLMYFLGDRSGPTRTCPETKGGWDTVLGEQKRHVGLGEEHPLGAKIHSLFLPVCPNNL